MNHDISKTDTYNTSKNRKIGKLVVLAPLFIALTIGLVALAVPVAPAQAQATVAVDDCGAITAASPSSSGYFVTSPALSTSMTWALTTPSKSSSGGVPGVLEFCVYPSGGTGTVTGFSTSAIGADSSAWTAGKNCPGTSCVHSDRSDGNPSNIPDNGGTTPNILTITFSAAPSGFVVVLHVIDSDECGSSSAGPNTCFIFPTTPPSGTTSISTTVVDETNPAFFPPGFAGDSFHDTATVSVVTANDGFTPTGTVFYLLSTSGCTGTFSSFDSEPVGTNSISTGPLGPGSYAFKAVYSGDSHYSGSTSDCEPWTVVAFPQPPTVSKTATGTYTTTFKWTITKSVDNTKVLTAGGSPATFNYAVTVTPDGGTISSIVVSGSIMVMNPNAVPMTVTVTDTLSDSTSCTVSGGGTGTIAPGDTATFTYSCLDSNSALPSSNSASVVWSSGPASGTASSGPVSISFTQTLVDDTVTVTDSNVGLVGTCSAITNPSGCTLTYSNTFSDPAGHCTSHDNTATFTTNTSSTSGTSNTVTVTDCQGADLTVSKDATASFDRQFGWTISKSVDQTTVTTTAGGPATFTYTVTVTHDAGTDKNWKVTGTIHIVNPNDWESITASVADAVDNGGSCTVSSSMVTVPMSGFVDVTYACTYLSAPSPSSGTNTATVTWDKNLYSTPSGSATGTAGFDFASVSPTLIDTCVAVSDTLGGSLGTVCVGDPNPKTFTYSHTFNDPIGVCTNHKNTATFTTNNTGTTGNSNTVTVTDCQTNGFVSDTAFCQVPLTQVNLIYIPDGGSSYTLKASNPGQFYYNFFFVGSAPSLTTFTATIPFPFVTQGNVPIQVFDATLFPSCPGTVPTSNFNSLFSISPTAIALTDYSPQNFGSNLMVSFTVGTGGLPTGSYWFAIHLDYGLKGFDYSRGSQTCQTATAVTGPSVTIPCGQSYTFSNTLSPASTITSTNSFKSDPGIGGLVLNIYNTPMQNVKVYIYSGTTATGKPIGTVYTDKDGWYMWSYKYTGKPTSFTVKLAAYPIQSTVTFKANGFVIVNFQQTATGWTATPISKYL